MNAERALIFPACIFTRRRGCSRSADIKMLITTRLDLREKGNILLLVILVEVEGQSGRLGGRTMGNNGIACGLYKPTDLDSKTGEPVIDVLRTD